jgi:hypothetical protein
MLRDNETPFAAIGFEQIHRDKRAMAVAAARACYLLSPDGSLALAPKQELALSDVYEGSPHTTPLLKASDLVPFKLGADVTVLGNAFATDDKPSERWTAGVKIDDHACVLRVHGPRQWEIDKSAIRPAWKLTPAQKTTQVPLDYRLASGGRVIGDPKGEADARNPIGAGIIEAKVTSPYFPYDAPQIDSESEPVNACFDRPAPQGFGPVPASWASRLDFIGTFDAAMRESGKYSLPADHDYRYWQSAHPDLRLSGYIRAGAKVTLRRLTPGGGVVEFQIPDIEPYAHFTFHDGREVFACMSRDGLHIDMRGPPPWKVDITFRSWIDICPQFFLINLGATDAKGALDLPIAGVDGLRGPGGWV